MKEPKKILLLIVAVILIGSVGYLTYLLQDGSFLTFNTRASTNTDGLLTEDPGNAGSDPIVPLSPTAGYQSTSPTQSPSVSPAVSISPSPTPTEEEPTPTDVVLIVETATPEPTVMESLPVAGASDYLPHVIVGGSALILLALFL